MTQQSNPTPEQFLTSPYEDEDHPDWAASTPNATPPQLDLSYLADPDAVWQIPESGPLEKIAEGVQQLVEHFTTSGASSADHHLAAANHQIQAQTEELSDLYDKHQVAVLVIDQIEEALGKSKAAPALAAKAVIEAWKNPKVEDFSDKLPAHVEESMTDPEYAASDVTLAGDPEEPLKPDTSEVEVHRLEVPEHGAPVEEWRAYARALGFAGPEIDTANRSQIRTALGLSQASS